MPLAQHIDQDSLSRFVIKETENMKICLSLAALFLCVMSAVAADVNGKWKASIAPTLEVTFEFKVEAGSFTACTITGPKGTSQLSDCKFTGDEISFYQKFGEGDRSFKIFYNGKVSGDEIKLHREIKGGKENGSVREISARKVS
jgi:hypothetical protein